MEGEREALLLERDSTHTHTHKHGGGELFFGGLMRCK